MLQNPLIMELKNHGGIRIFPNRVEKFPNKLVQVTFSISFIQNDHAHSDSRNGHSGKEIPQVLYPSDLSSQSILRIVQLRQI